jgi:hypothetical protein
MGYTATALRCVVEEIRAALTLRSQGMLVNHLSTSADYD